MYPTAKDRIKAALRKLLESYDLDVITVTMLSCEAGVNRNTYYYHYYRVEEVLEDVCDDLARELAEHIVQSADSDAGVADRAGIAYFQTLSDNSGWICGLMASGKDRILRDALEQAWIRGYGNWIRANLEEDDATSRLARYLFAGHYDLLCSWILEGCSRPIEDVRSEMLEVFVGMSQ